MFGRKNQEKLDAAFLKAVSRHDFEQAQKLLKKGANVLAQDAEGNTALHQLTGASFYKHAKWIDEFVYFLLRQNLDIHARNKQGQTCLHVVAEKQHDCDEARISYFMATQYFKRCSAVGMVEILLKRGVRIGDKDDLGRTLLHRAAARGDVSLLEMSLRLDPSLIAAQDNLGRTLLHVAATGGYQDMINRCLKADPSLVAIQDNEGKYPHQIVIARSAEHYDLLQDLKARLDAYQAPKAQPETAAPPANDSDDHWVLLKPDQVARISVEKAIGYKLTEIFNFSRRTYARITHNLETRTDVSETRGFDEFPDKAAFAAARQELLRLGGQADEVSIYGQVLDKKRPPFSKDA